MSQINMHTHLVTYTHKNIIILKCKNIFFPMIINKNFKVNFIKIKSSADMKVEVIQEKETYINERPSATGSDCTKCR